MVVVWLVCMFVGGLVGPRPGSQTGRVPLERVKVMDVVGAWTAEQVEGCAGHVRPPANLKDLD